MNREEHAAAVTAAAQEYAAANERFLAQLRVDLASTHRGVVEKGDHVFPFSRSARPTTVPNTLKGFSLHETTGAAGALVYLRDGVDSSGPIVSVISLVAGESTRDYFGERGLSLNNGLYVDVASGAVEGAVYLGAS